MSRTSPDYDRFVAGAGYAELTGWTSIRVTGGDRVAFLNNLCTNNVNRLQSDQGCEAFFTDVKGHILAHTIILTRPEAIWIWTVPGQAEPLTKHLDKYIIREDVELEDRSPGVRLVVLSAKSLAQVLPPELNARLGQPLANLEAPLGPADSLVAACDWFGPDAVLVQVPRESYEPLQSFLDERGVAACDGAVLETLRVERGTPYFGADFDARNLPQEVNRNARAIDFQKGCYLGQETVARIDALGHVNRLLVGVRFDGSDVPPRDTPLLAGDGDKEIGRVTSVVWSPRLEHPLGLAMIRRGHTEPGTRLESAAGPTEVVALPSVANI